MSLTIATCKNLPDWEQDDRSFHEALNQLGIEFELKPWDAKPFLNEKTQAVLIRTTWDYQENHSSFFGGPKKPRSGFPS